VRIIPKTCTSKIWLKPLEPEIKSVNIELTFLANYFLFQYYSTFSFTSLYFLFSLRFLVIFSLNLLHFFFLFSLFLSFREFSCSAFSMIPSSFLSVLPMKGFFHSSYSDIFLISAINYPTIFHKIFFNCKNTFQCKLAQF
jgi:hypothetical protein